MWLRLVINFFCSQYALIMYANIKSEKEHNNTEYRLFLIYLKLVIAILLSHSLFVITNGRTDLTGRRLLLLSSVLTFTLIQIIPLLYFFYVDAVIYKTARTKRNVSLITLPVSVSILFVLLSLRGGYFFHIDDQGYYQNGPYLYAPIVIGFGYILYSVFRVMRNRKYMSLWEFESLMIFSSPLIVCGTLQSFFQKLPLFIPSLIISLLLLYTNILERRFSFDHLTGIFNRKKMEEYLELLIASSRSSGAPLAAFLADVNKFKYINDTYGHTEGDRALVQVAKTIRKGIRNIDILARYAGDEFVAIFPDCSEVEIKMIIDRIHQEFRNFSEANEEYPLSISIGYAIYDPSLDRGIDGFIKRMDELMYEDKKRSGSARK